MPTARAAMVTMPVWDRISMKAILLLRRPAVAARADGGGGEGEGVRRRRGFGGQARSMFGHEGLLRNQKKEPAIYTESGGVGKLFFTVCSDAATRGGFTSLRT